MLIGERSAEFVETILVVDHLFAGIARHRVLSLKKNRFLGTNFLAKAAVNAAEHIDIESLRPLFNVRAIGLVLGNFAWRDADGFRRTDEFTELTRHAFLAAM